jgi:hypothetical protein
LGRVVADHPLSRIACSKARLRAAWRRTSSAPCAQADALRRRGANEIDWDNVAEEIESSGRNDRRQIEHRLENLILHLIKWKYQSEWQSPSWPGGSIVEARHRVKSLIDESPSLRECPGEHLSRAYAYARPKALIETGLYRLPEVCPWTIDEILDEEFLS